MTSTKKHIGIAFATQYTELIIQFLSVLVLARILSPDDIGTYSVAAFLMTLLHVFRDFGVVQYIIQERELTAEKIQSAMGVAILLALTVALVMLASSSYVARLYGNPALEKILVVMAASFAISPFGSLLIGIFRREMQLRAIFFIKLVSALCHVSVSLSLALHGFGAISLAWANFAGILSFGIAANIMRPKGMPWLPRFTNIKTVLSFGGVASLGNAANIAGTNIPDLVIGKVMNMAAVGYFSRANGLVQLFTKLITGALLPLVLPYFAQIRREGKDLAVPYLTAVEYLTALSWPFFSVTMLLAYPLVRTLYGPQWDASVPVVELLCLAGAIASLSLFAAQVMVAGGQVRNSTYSQVIAQPFRVAAVLFASAQGLQAIAMALIVSECLTLLIVSRYLHKTIKVGLPGLLHACGKSALVAFCSAIVPAIVKFAWNDDPARPWLPLSIGILGAGAGWIAGMLLTRHSLTPHFTPHLTPLLRPFLSSGAPGMTGHRNGWKLALKNLAYRSGALGLYHRIRNRRTLTVAMFHRVLPASDPRYPGADPEWTMTPESFTQCIAFFRKHYRIVSPDEVFAALRSEARLPGRSLLVTFDDGWADTAEYAQPILAQHSVSALIFVAGRAIGQTGPFWEEQVYSYLATEPTGMHRLEAAFAQHGMAFMPSGSGTAGEQAIRACIARLGQLDGQIRAAILSTALSTIQPAADALPAMLNAAQLVQLAASHAIGGHGMVHQPLTTVENLEEEVRQAQASLSSHLKIERVESMSFPHGAYSEDIMCKCRHAGYRYFFSSDAFLNAIDPGTNAARPVGRIHISEREITGRKARFHPALLATSLFMRDRIRLTEEGGA